MDFLKGKMSAIPLGVPFLETVAEYFLKATAKEPHALSQVSLILPTQRSCRVLKKQFMASAERQKRTVFLPKMLVISELSDPTRLDLEWDLESFDVISYHARFGLLMQLVKKHFSSRETFTVLEHQQAIQLTQNLLDLIDEVHTEKADLSKIEELVPEDYSEHWKDSLEFLKIISHFWPEILKEKKQVDHKQALNHGLDHIGYSLKHHSSPNPIIAVGITGSFPGSREFLASLVENPKCGVILNGLDLEIDDESWETLDHCHPQYVYKKLLDAAHYDRHAVEVINGVETSSEIRDRIRLLQKIMQNNLCAVKDYHLTFDQGFGILECDSMREEAFVIALAVREGLEDDNRTIALITPNRMLADMVRVELKRWKIIPDDSAGFALSETSLGAYSLLVNDFCQSQFSAAKLLGILKHPLTVCGVDEQVRHMVVERIEIEILRQPLSPQNMNDFDSAFEKWFSNGDDGYEFIRNVLDILNCYKENTKGKQALELLVDAHQKVLGALIEGNNLGLDEEERDVFETFMESLKASRGEFGPLNLREYVSLLSEFMNRQMVRQPQGYHSRVFVLGPMEARLLHFDRVILAGLNEGVWPSEKAESPWLSRHMRHTMGLPSLEQYIGFSAHDFFHSASMPEVFITRTTKMSGSETIASRWVTRIKMAKEVLKDQSLDSKYDPLLRLARELIKIDEKQIIERPSPKPPVDTRPKKLSVTDVEKLIRDPYQIYAKHMLRLKPLNELGLGLESTAFGNLIHSIFEDYMKRINVDSTHRQLKHLIETGRQHFEPIWFYPMVQQFWWPQFLCIAEWFYEQDIAQKLIAKSHHVEVMGQITISCDAGELIIYGKADRIDVLKDNSIEVIDYKTGQLPTATDIKNGVAVQLPLESLIAVEGGFPSIQGGLQVEGMSYWSVKGRLTKNEKKDLENVSDLVLNVRMIVEDLITRYSNPDSSYPAIPDPKIAPAYNDYEHLSRFKEWDNQLN